MTAKSPCIEHLHESRIKVEEKGKSAVFLNPQRLEVLRVKVDGCLRTNTIASDWIVASPDCGDIVIELKGCDVSRAIDQIIATLAFWRNHELCSTSQSALIVCSRYPRFDTKLQRGKVKLQKKNVFLRVESRNLEYEFTDFLPRPIPNPA